MVGSTPYLDPCVPGRRPQQSCRSVGFGNAENWVSRVFWTVHDIVLNRFIDACMLGLWTATDHVVCGCLNPSIRGMGGDNRTGGRSPEKPGEAVV